MDVKLIKNILSDQDLKDLEDAIDIEFKNRSILKFEFPPSKDIKINQKDYVIYSSNFGRIDIKYPNIPNHILDKVYDTVKNNLDGDIELLDRDFSLYAEYTRSSGGNPRLEPHFDVVDFGTLILDYQFKSNKVWEIKVESDFFALEDNSGILFDPLEKMHSRPFRNFKDNEFVKMIFFRFKTSSEVKPKTGLDKEALRFEQSWHINEDRHDQKLREQYENR